MHSLPTGSRNSGKSFNSWQAGCFWSYGLFIGMITLSARAVTAIYGHQPCRATAARAFILDSEWCVEVRKGPAKECDQGRWQRGTHVSGNEVNDARNPSENAGHS